MSPWWVVPALLLWVAVTAAAVLLPTKEEPVIDQIRRAWRQLPPYAQDLAERLAVAGVLGAVVAYTSGERSWGALAGAAVAAVLELLRGTLAKRTGDPTTASFVVRRDVAAPPEPPRQ